MEAEQPSCSARCPHCGHLNEFTGMDTILLYTWGRVAHRFKFRINRLIAAVRQNEGTVAR